MDFKANQQGIVHNNDEDRVDPIESYEIHNMQMPLFSCRLRGLGTTNKDRSYPFIIPWTTRDDNGKEKDISE